LGDDWKGVRTAGIDKRKEWRRGRRVAGSEGLEEEALGKLRCKEEVNKGGNRKAGRLESRLA
jgi:hypothetical protein